MDIEKLYNKDIYSDIKVKPNLSVWSAVSKKMSFHYFLKPSLFNFNIFYLSAIITVTAVTTTLIISKNNNYNKPEKNEIIADTVKNVVLIKDTLKDKDTIIKNINYPSDTVKIIENDKIEENKTSPQKNDIILSDTVNVKDTIKIKDNPVIITDTVYYDDDDYDSEDYENDSEDE